MDIHIDPTKRHDFVLLFDAVNSNPNGDPDAGNQPRVDPDTNHGLVTDVALKRKVRNYVALAGHPIFIQSQVSLNSLIVEGFRKAGVQPAQVEVKDEALLEWAEGGLPDGFTFDEGVLTYAGESNSASKIEKLLWETVENTEENKALRQKLRALAKQLAAAGGATITPQNRVEARNQLCRDYFDIRMFGAVLATGLNAGQVRGPMQLTFARSINPVRPRDLTITRQARTTAERMETGSTEMGRKQLVNYGLYEAHGFYSPQLGQGERGTGVTSDDLALFWEALERLFWHDRSAARPEMNVQGLYVFTHESPLGNAPAHRLFRRVSVTKRLDPETKKPVEAPRSIDDYDVRIDWPREGEDREHRGVTLTRLVDAEAAAAPTAVAPTGEVGSVALN